MANIHSGTGGSFGTASKIEHAFYEALYDPSYAAKQHTGIFSQPNPNGPTASSAKPNLIEEVAASSDPYGSTAASAISGVIPNSGWSVPSSPSWSYTNADLAMSYGMDKNTAYQEALANTSHQRAVKDLQAAGLNPVLSANGGSGAAVFSGSEYSTSASGGGSAAAKPLLNANSAKAFGALAGALIGAATHTSVSMGSSLGSKAGEVVAAIVNS